MTWSDRLDLVRDMCEDICVRFKTCWVGVVKSRVSISRFFSFRVHCNACIIIAIRATIWYHLVPFGLMRGVFDKEINRFIFSLRVSTLLES